MQGGCGARPTRFAGVDSLVLVYSPNPDREIVYMPIFGAIRFSTTSVADINYERVVNLDDVLPVFNGCDSASSSADFRGDGEGELLDCSLFFNLLDAE